MGRRRVLVLCPTDWDERQFASLAPEVRARYELVYDELRDADVRWDLDVAAFVDQRVRAWRGRIDGVFSSSDYPGTLAAAALAAELGLPGPQPASVLRAAHKYYARLVQREVVPGCVPRFALFEPSDPGTWPADESFPCFVKPVKASFSLFARRIEDRAALARFAASPALAEFRQYYVRLFDRFAARHVRFEHGASAMLAEELLDGRQVTVEGWVEAGRARVLGVVDTSFHAGTRSFASFDYPSSLSRELQTRLGRAACSVAEALGLDQTLFNVEFFCDPGPGPGAERIGLIEINPRLCGQFCDLYDKVDGKHGLELALELACGEAPRPARRPARFAAAASVPLRTFRSARLVRVPSTELRRELERLHPGLLVWSEVAAGDEFSVGPDVEDGVSVRYGVLNLGGQDRAEISAKARALELELGFELSPRP